MRPVKRILWAFVLAMPFLILNAGTVSAETDDYTPEVTDRVARISFISGSVQIKRADQTDWERAANNLPLVEGDEIVTDSNARLEIQFNSETYLRLSENAYLKITTLRDEGIAVSLPNGSLSARVLNFNKERAYFEIDAPQTTVSIEKAGMYRVDAGSKNDQTVRVSVTDSGQAKIYSENSGFTLKNGRSATIQIDGNYAGEWETADAAKYADDFDEWALERDAIVAKRLEDSYYDKYYDRDIYGAEDLSEYGEWVFTKKYGYVWKPYRSATSSYSDWSPYRYGQWRWIPAYGWTWVNDEPWGWATYHHGRWVWDSGYWYWSPYSQYRSRRSWWQPALVYIGYIGNNVCWYPLPYDYGYYNYNSYYYTDRRRYNTTIINNTTVIVNPTPTPNPTPVVTVGAVLSPGQINPKMLPPTASVPPTGVVTVEASGFGTGKANFRTAPVDLAKKALAQSTAELTKAPMLPTFKQLNGSVSREIIATAPPRTRTEMPIKIGATDRVNGVPMGESLRKERILGNRPPIENAPPIRNNDGIESAPPIRNTGAVKRQPRVESSGDNNPVREPSNDGGLQNTNTVRGNNNGGENQPIRKPRIRSNDNQIPPPMDSAPPVYNPPPREERIERPQPPRRERQEPPVRQEPPRQEPRVEAPARQEPRREEPRPQPPPRQETLPPKPEPPAEKPAAPNNETRIERKDG